MLQEVLIQGSDLGTCRAVHKYRIEDIHIDDFITQILQGAGSRSAQTLLVIGKRKSLAVEQRITTAGNTYYIQLESLFLHQFFALSGNLFNQATAHSAYPTQEEVQHTVFRQEETVVNHIQRLSQISRFHNKGNIGLGNTLRTSNDINTVAPQSTEQFSGHSRNILHAFAYNSYGSQSATGLHREHGAGLNFLGKLFIQYTACLFYILVTHTN